MDIFPARKNSGQRPSYSHLHCNGSPSSAYLAIQWNSINSRHGPACSCSVMDPWFDLLELGVEPEVVDSPHLHHHDLSFPSSASETAQLPRRHGSKVELVAARFIASSFAAAIVCGGCRLHNYHQEESCGEQQVRAQYYPNILVTAGLNDPRVLYSEPAKFVAKLRATKTDGNLLLFKCELGAGHFSKSGRFEKLQEDAFTYAFILKALDMAPPASS